jgi:trehalose/maltose hydrolase-like predicted phosphorylase
MNNYGLELLVEIARFWESKAAFDETTQRYSIDKVMGPDEFHESYPDAKDGGLKDNAYTNLMSVWMFNQINHIFEDIGSKTIKSLGTKIGFKASELQSWKQIASKIKLIISNEGIIAQYDGYFDLDELDWDYYHKKYNNIHRMDRILKAEGKTTDAFKVAKQADTLMLFYNLSKKEVSSLVDNLGYKLPEDYVKRNLDYYLQRTSHGSTLSRVVHSYLARQIGLDDLSWEMFQAALSSDFNDIQGGTTAEGIHTGVMAGTVWIVYAAFAGINFSADILSLNPKLPKLWRELKFSLQFRNNKYSFGFTENRLLVVSESDVKINVQNKEYQLKKGQELSIELV